jgi:2-oxoacid:acceptor oxidoreductase gamma subunit (pyruvate/2-ketoisovalerate family)
MNSNYIEVRWHGRGGQGAVTAAEILAQAAFYEGFKGVTAAPFFGAERRGAPVVATNRFSREPVRTLSLVRQPSVVVVMDETILRVVDVAAGIKPDGIIIINSKKAPDQIGLPSSLRIAVTDATRWATEAGLIVSGTVMFNTAILGGFSKATGLVGMESLEKALREHFSGEACEKNVQGARLASEGTVVSGT